jgi:hypothetical protein
MHVDTNIIVFANICDSLGWFGSVMTIWNFKCVLFLFRWGQKAWKGVLQEICILGSLSALRCQVRRSSSVASVWGYAFGFFFFGATGVWTQDFMLAKKVLYLLRHTSSPFCSGYFGDGVLRNICLGWPWTISLLTSASQVTRITGLSHQHLDEGVQFQRK